jgi:hypothetical protein
LKEHRVAWFRLGFYNPLAIYLPLQYEKLRCRAKYDALRFSQKVIDYGQKLVDKMKAMGDGRFVGMHLRFEEVRFDSGCLMLRTPSTDLLQQQERFCCCYLGFLSSLPSACKGSIEC